MEKGTIRQMKTTTAHGPDGLEVEMEVVVDHLADNSLVCDFIADKTDEATGERIPGTGERLHIPESCPVLLRVIIEALWSGDPAARPDAAQIILFIARRCVLLTEAPQWEPDEESAAKIKAWIVDDLGIHVPKPMELFEQFNYEALIEVDPMDDFRNMLDDLGDAGLEYVCSDDYKAMCRELTALNMLNKAVQQEPLKNALAEACAEAEMAEGSEATQRALGDALDAAREKIATQRAEEKEERKEEKKKAEASEAAAGDEGKEEVIEGKEEGRGLDFRVLRASKKRYRDFGTACKNGDVEEVRRLFALDNNLSSTRSTIDDAQGKVWTDTPLGWAVSSSSTEVVEYLLGHGADPNQMGAYV